MGKGAERRYTSPKAIGRGDGRDVPGVRGPTPPFVVGIAVSDVHLTLAPPKARSAEPDWMKAQKRHLDQVANLKKKHNCPVIYAGDIFHRWTQQPELISFAIKELPEGYAVPGQHDLYMHSYADIRKTAYWTLVEAGKIQDIKPHVPTPAGDHLLLHGFPWGVDVRPCVGSHLVRGYNVAVVHAYVWNKKNSYPGAPPEKHYQKWLDRLKGYRVGIFGDNHLGFMIKGNDTTILNNGAFIRRNSDEVNYRPKVGLLWNTGDVTRVELDTGDDLFRGTGNERRGAVPLDLEEFLTACADFKEDMDSFVEAVLRYMQVHGVDKRLKDTVLRMLERVKK